MEGIERTNAVMIYLQQQRARFAQHNLQAIGGRTRTAIVVEVSDTWLETREQGNDSIRKKVGI